LARPANDGQDVTRRAPAFLVLAWLGIAGCAAANAANATNSTTGSSAPLSTNSAPGDLDEVMHVLSLRQHGRVEFVEQHFLAVLNHPIESSGEMRYDAPDHLEKRTLLPRPENLLLAGGELTVERGGHTRVLDLHRYPQIQPFVESIRATLAGDRAALERVFRVEFAGTVGQWSLTLFPLDRQLAKSVAEVRIDGMRDQLLRVEIRQADGDRSLMTLRTPAKP
jgi:Outer membrane lipoprotein carrier protein LolA-like